MKEKNKEKCPPRERLGKFGGQAVLEGIMMKAGDQCATACRKEDGSVAVVKREFVSVRKKHKLLNIPILRGVVNFVETLRLSYGTLAASASIAGLDTEEEEGRFEKWMKKHFGVALFDVIMVIAAVLGVVLALFLFMYLPTLCANGVFYLIGQDMPVLRAVLEGVIKMAIFISYIALVGLMPDIRRTFEYHGAEHKTIACYEAGEELLPELAAKHSRLHPRCGTSFMFVMILLGIFAGMFVRLVFPSLPTFLYVLVRLLILPLVVGIGYEFIMYAGKHTNLLTRVCSAPGLLMQKLTTCEPSVEQLEVAIIAVKCAMPEEYPDFDATPYLENANTEKAGEKTEDTAEASTEEAVEAEVPTEEAEDAATEAEEEAL